MSKNSDRTEATQQHRPKKIRGVICIEQKDVKIYTFAMSANALLALGKIERFGESDQGVNRQLNMEHAMEIAEAMLDQNLLWAEPFLGDMRGAWVHDPESNEIAIGEEAFFSIDDGQHRFHALSVLNAEERDRLVFTVTGTIGLSRERRIHIFRMQAERRPIDPRLDLAQRHEIDSWNKPVDKEAYEILLALNENEDSVIKGELILSEQASRPYEGRHRPVGINGRGLFTTIRTVINQRSPLSSLSKEKRLEVIKNMLRAASEVWKKQWRSEHHMLTTARGINTVLLLLVKSPNFRGAIGDKFGSDSLKSALALASKFDWSSTKRKNDAPAKLVDALDNAIGRARSTAANQ